MRFHNGVPRVPTRLINNFAIHVTSSEISDVERESSTSSTYIDNISTFNRKKRCRKDDSTVFLCDNFFHYFYIFILYIDNFYFLRYLFSHIQGREPLVSKKFYIQDVINWQVKPR